jgi:hypothetical protein
VSRPNKKIRIVIHFLVFTNGHYFGVVILLNKIRILDSKNEGYIKCSMKFETIGNDL